MLLTAAVAGAVSILHGWRAEGRASTSREALRPGRPAFEWLPVGALIGLRLAFGSRRPADARSVRTTLSGITLGFLTVIATVVFSAGLRHLVSTPQLWGATWQARVGDGFAPDVEGRVGSGLLADPWVRNVAAGTAVQLQLEDRVRVDAFAVDVVRGELGPLALEGRGPRAADEIFLGTAAVRRLGSTSVITSTSPSALARRGSASSAGGRCRSVPSETPG